MRKYIEWDAAKAASNLRKHGVSFAVAGKVFDDPLAVTKRDHIENGELRWQTIGIVEGVLLLLVAHTLQDFDDEDFDVVVRIISARHPTKMEKKHYENG